jgi:hypothetical protein
MARVVELADAARSALSALRRLTTELRAVSNAGDGDAALSRLSVRFEGDSVAFIEASDAGPRLDALGEGGGGTGARGVDVVRIDRDLYARVPTADARVRLLSLAARAARAAIELHVTVNAENSHLGRLAIDAPRRLLRAAGARTADPGDRFGPERFAHCFFDEESLLEEVGRAGLVCAARRGFVFTLRPAARGEARAPSERAEPFATELGRVARRVHAVDAARVRGTPQRVLAELRASGARAKERGPIGRARLRRAIGWVDAAHPAGPNCYRRVLLELALDAGAARETVVFGLDVGSTGHVAFEDREERTFDVAFSIRA